MSERTGSTGLRRSLGVRDLMVYGLLFIAPMAPVGVFGVLDAKSHGAVAAVWAARRDDGLDQLTSVVNVGALTAFALLHASVIGWYAVRPHSRDRLRYVLVPALGIAVIVAAVVEASHTAQWVGGIWLLVGLGVLALQGVGGRR